MKDIYKKLLQNKSVLIAEDNKNIQLFFKEILSMYVDKVYIASNGEEALRLFKENRVDILFSDLNMPKLNGLELSKSLRTMSRRLPIVIISAFAPDRAFEEFRRENNIDYLTKPLSYDKLMLTLEKCAQGLAA
jgi:CheY-like chemotaxis protein